MDLGLPQQEFAIRIERVAQSFIATVESLSESLIIQPETHGNWSGKDVLAHCTFWAEYGAEIIRRSIHRTFVAADFYYDDEVAFDQKAVNREAGTDYRTLLLRFRQAASETADLTRALSPGEWNSTPRYRILIAGTILEEVPEHEYQLRSLLTQGQARG
jgi:hypothetical protein